MLEDFLFVVSMTEVFFSFLNLNDRYLGEIIFFLSDLKFLNIIKIRPKFSSYMMLFIAFKLYKYL